MLYRGGVLVGMSEATDNAGVSELQRVLSDLGSFQEVVPVPFSHRGVIHLDTKFNIVGEHVAVIARKSFRPDTIKWFERHFDLIDATEKESRSLEVNVLAIGNGRVIVREESERLSAKLQQKGLTPIAIDYSEVALWPGAFRCTTLPIERASTKPGTQ